MIVVLWFVAKQALRKEEWWTGYAVKQLVTVQRKILNGSNLLWLGEIEIVMTVTLESYGRSAAIYRLALPRQPPKTPTAYKAPVQLSPNGIIMRGDSQIATGRRRKPAWHSQQIFHIVLYVDIYHLNSLSWQTQQTINAVSNGYQAFMRSLFCKQELFMHTLVQQ